MRKKTTTIRLDTEIFKAVAEYAEAEDLSQNQVISRAVKDFLRREAQEKKAAGG
jgi:predicted transcriptional regulator